MFKLSQFIVLVTVFCVVAIAAPIQELPPRAGHVPVYIREGNTPLSQVNPKLVEAFHEDEEFSQLPIENERTKERADDEVALQATKEVEQEIKPEITEEENKEINAEADDTNVATSEAKETETAAVEVAEASDIAELTQDDLKIVAAEKTDN
ncbi:hypothetical protein DOY81_004269 [Sarcophaga bullata]|nr:hypothetical protein DOY81_004269 [Sarcophaga bullata]